MSLERRLTNLEARAPGTKWETPIEVLVHLKAVERHRSRACGEEPPPYTQEEIAHMHAEDLAEAAGGGVVGLLRDSAGWTSPEALQMLNAWEDAARRRLERVEDGDPLEVVYNELLDEEELDE